jgi:glutathione S-transferase
MLKLYHADRMRSARIYWLLEEVGLSYQLETVGYVPHAVPFSQHTPLGKFPVLEDGDLTMMESGAIVEYVLDRYGRGRLAPEHGSHLHGQFLQWIHFAEATLMPPVVEIFRHTRLKPEPERIPAVVIDARARAAAIRVRLHKRIKTLTGFRAFLSHAPGKMLMADTESSHAEMLPLEPPEVPAGHPR